MGRTRDRERWNHNIHYHRVVLDAVPGGCRRALDVGCGEGLLTRQLAEVVPEVVGIDVDEPSLELARAGDPPGAVTFLCADLLDGDLQPGSFDLVASIATLHHMDTAEGLRRMGELVRPGGVLVVVGLARSRLPRDLPVELAGAVATRFHSLTKTYWEHSAPVVWPPADTYHEVAETARSVLPGVRYRRHLLWRYSLTWTRPAEPV